MENYQCEMGGRCIPVFMSRVWLCSKSGVMLSKH